jgi:hypothetical protein
MPDIGIFNTEPSRMYGSDSLDDEATIMSSSKNIRKNEIKIPVTVASVVLKNDMVFRDFDLANK